MGKISPCEALAGEILRLNAEGTPRRKIAETFGLSYVTVQAWLQRRKIPGIPPKQRRVKLDPAKLDALLTQNLPQHEIARRFGVSLSCVQKSAYRHALETSRTGPKSGEKHSNWGAGRMLDKHGYVLIWVPLHPRCTLGGYVREHRLVLEVALGRYLRPSEASHHLDNHPHHNWPSNLAVFESNADHLKHELTGREKATPRASIPGAYGSNQTIPRCPDELETLALCPSETREKLARHIEIHRPSIKQQKAPRRTFLRSGARLPPFA